MLVGWIPFLGLVGVPTAIIGLVLAGVGFLIGLLKGATGIGMPLLGSGICLAALIVAILATGGTSAAMNEAVRDASEQLTTREKGQAVETQQNGQVHATREKKQEDVKAKAKAAYIRRHLVLYDVQAKYKDSLLDGKVAGVLFKLRNNGDRSLDEVKVTVYFKDAGGAVIHEEDYYPVLVSDFSVGDNTPLKPGYIWQMESGKFYEAKSVPSEWQEGAVQAKITDVQFSTRDASKQLTTGEKGQAVETQLSPVGSN